MQWQQANDAIAAVKAWLEKLGRVVRGKFKVVGKSVWLAMGWWSCMRPAYVSDGHFISLVADPGNWP